MSEHVHEPEHERGGRRGRQVAAEPRQHGLALLGREDLLVVHRDPRRGQFVDLPLEELVLERVVADLAAPLPPLRTTLGEFVREDASEDRVARERGRGRQEARVERLLDLEVFADDGEDGPPLVQPHAVHHDEQRRRVLVEDRSKEAGQHIHREGRPPLASLVHPLPVPVRHEVAEPPAQLGVQSLEDLAQARLAGLLQPQVPVDELRVEVGPIPPRRRGGDPLPQLAEAAREIARDVFVAQGRAGEEPGHDREHLPGTRRFDDVVVRPPSDRLVHGRFFFALRDHHHGEARGGTPDAVENLDPAQPRHPLIQQHEVVGSRREELHRVLAVHHGIDVISRGTQQHEMRTQQVDFVVHPEDPARHGLRPFGHMRPFSFSDMSGWPAPASARHPRRGFSTCAPAEWPGTALARHRSRGSRETGPP